MLSDTAGEIIPAFGLANPQYPKGSSWYGVALPIVFAIDPDGIIRHRFSGADHRDAVDIDLVLDVVKRDAKQ